MPPLSKPSTQLKRLQQHRQPLQQLSESTVNQRNQIQPEQPVLDRDSGLSAPLTPRSYRKQTARLAVEAGLTTPERRRQPTQHPLHQPAEVIREELQQQLPGHSPQQAPEQAGEELIELLGDPEKGPEPFEADQLELPAPDYYRQTHPGQRWRPCLNAGRAPLQPDFEYRFILVCALSVCAHCCVFHWIEERQGNFFKRASIFTYCLQGVIDLPFTPPYPPEL